MAHIIVNPGYGVHGTLAIFFPQVVTASSSVSSTTLTEGLSVILTCQAESNPPASLSWRRLGRKVEFPGSAASLTLGPVTRAIAGVYQCNAENELGLN